MPRANPKPTSSALSSDSDPVKPRRPVRAIQKSLNERAARNRAAMSAKSGASQAAESDDSTEPILTPDVKKRVEDWMVKDCPVPPIEVRPSAIKGTWNPFQTVDPADPVDPGVPAGELVLHEKEDDLSADDGPNRSMVLLSVKRLPNIGVNMDMATKFANDKLQEGKAALEMAGTMSGDMKKLVHESLQALYETALSLSESRMRQMKNVETEKEKSKNEIARLERLHAKELLKMSQAHSKQMSTVTDRLETLSSVYGSLSERVKDIAASPRKHAKDLMEQIRVVADNTKLLYGETRKNKAQTKKAMGQFSPPKEGLLGKGDLESISRQIDALRREVGTLDAKVQESIEVGKETDSLVRTVVDEPPSSIEPKQIDFLEKMLVEVGATLTRIEGRQEDLVTAFPDHWGEVGRLETIETGVRTVREDLREIKDMVKEVGETAATPMLPLPSMPTLADELGVLGRGALIPPTQGVSYAEMARRTVPMRTPNHTLIVSSKDPQRTSERVMEDITSALDIKKTGLRVARLRAARNQKVVLGCDTREEMEKVNNQLQKYKALSTSVASSRKPLIKIRDVAKTYTDEEIVKLLKMQNQDLLAGIPEQEVHIQLRTRKRARSDQACHPILEVSPSVYRSFIQVGMVYLGLQRRQVEDQSPLIQCSKCLGYGHTRRHCKEANTSCSFCGEGHIWADCEQRKRGDGPKCTNCDRAKASDTGHVAFNNNCPIRQRWDAIARSRVDYCT